MRITVSRLTLVCVSLAIVLIFTGQSAVALSLNDVAAVWMLDEGRGDVVEDLSGNDNDGQIQGPTWVAGKFGSALSFDGADDRVVVPDADSLDLPGAWTITGWMFINESESNYAHMLGKRNDVLGQANYCFRTNNVGTAWEAYFKNVDWKGVWGQGTVREGVWLYMTATYDGVSTMTLYEDGVEIGSAADVGGPPPVGASDVILGGWQDNTSELIDGMLDEIVLFSVAISVDDIQTLMDKGIERGLGITPVEPLGKLTATWGSIKKVD